MTTCDIQDLVKILYGVKISPMLVSEITEDFDGEVKDSLRTDHLARLGRSRTGFDRHITETVPCSSEDMWERPRLDSGYSAYPGGEGVTLSGDSSTDTLRDTGDRPRILPVLNFR